MYICALAISTFNLSCQLGNWHHKQGAKIDNDNIKYKWGKIVGISRLSPSREQSSGRIGYEVGKGAGNVLAGEPHGLAAGIMLGTITHYTEEAAGNRDRLLMAIELDSGEEIRVEQKVKWLESFSIGDRVKVYENKVTH